MQVPHIQQSCNILLKYDFAKRMLSWQDSKLGQTDLVCGLWSEYISRSVHARLQVSVCSSHDLCHTC